MKNYTLDEYYKVPFRMVYCETLWGWICETFYCHVWIKMFPKKFNAIPQEKKV